jgi:hypothetical protein
MSTYVSNTGVSIKNKSTVAYFCRRIFDLNLSTIHEEVIFGHISSTKAGLMRNEKNSNKESSTEYGFMQNVNAVLEQIGI